MLKLGAVAASCSILLGLLARSSLAAPYTLEQLADQPCSLAPANGSAGSVVSLQDTTLQLDDCQTLATWGTQLCASPSLLAMDMVVNGSSLHVISWESAGCRAQNLTVVCNSSSSVSAANTTRCAGTFITSAAQLASTLEQLQPTHDNVTFNIAVHSTIDMGDMPRSYNFTRNVRIQSNETGRHAWLNTAAGAAQFVIQPSSSGLLELSWIGLTNLAFGPPSSFMNSGFVGYFWAFSFPRLVNQVYFRVLNVDLAVPPDLYKFLLVWFTRLLSPIASVHQSALWIAVLPNATLDKFELAVTPGAADVIYNTYRAPPGQEWVNVTIAAAPTLNQTLMPNVSHSGVLDITFDPENYASTLQLSTVCSPAAVLAAINRTLDKPYMVDYCNTSFTDYQPVPLASLPQNGLYPNGPMDNSTIVTLPAVLPPGAAVLLQTHPLIPSSLDLGGGPCVLVLPPTSILRLRNFTIYNGGVQQPGTGPPAPQQNFTSGMWTICNVSADTSLFLEHVTLVVPQEEFNVLRATALGRPCNCKLTSTERSMLQNWHQSSAVTQVNDTTLYVELWAGWRWRGSQITITADSRAGAYSSLPLAAGVMYGQPSDGAEDPSAGSTGGGSSVPVAAWAVPLAVGLPLLLLALLLFVLHRRRLRERQRSAQGSAGEEDKRYNKDMARSGPAAPGSPKGLPAHSAANEYMGAQPHAGACDTESCTIDMPLPSLPPSGSGRSLVGVALPPQPLSPRAAALAAATAAAAIAAAGTASTPDVQLPPTPQLSYSAHGGLQPGEQQGHAEAQGGAGLQGHGSSHGVTALGTTAAAAAGVAGAASGPAGWGGQPGQHSHPGGPGLPSSRFSGRPGLRALIGSQHGAFSPESSRVYASVSSGSRSSIGSVSDASDLSGSHLLMSDSFDRPGSEYGDYNLVATQDMDSILRGIRAELSDTSKLIIYGVLGAGAHGVVYKGEWRGRPVAVKTLLFQEHVLGGRGKQQAMQEVAVNSRFAAHPNIVNTFTYELKPITQQQQGQGGQRGSREGLTINELHGGAGDYKLYIVQEFCDAGHLKKWIDSGRLLQEGTAQPYLLSVVQVALDLACGLQHVHFKNVIHGDLSPANVLLKSDPNRPGPLKAVAKVGDFGLSRFVNREQSHVSNVRAGTPFYTAPEVMLHGQLTRAADVFSLGVILYELFCGQPPWRRKVRAQPGHKSQRRSRKPTSSPQASGLTPTLSCPNLHPESNPPTPNPTVPSNVQDSQPQQTSGTGVLDAGASTTPEGSSAAVEAGGTADSAEVSGPSLPPPQQQGLEEACATYLSVFQQQQQAQDEGSGQTPPLSEDAAATGGSGGLGSGGLVAVQRAARSVVSAASECTELQDSTQAQLAALHRYMAAPKGTYPLQLPPSCPQWYRQLVVNCLQADPAARPKLPGVVTLLMQQQTSLLEQFQQQQQQQQALELGPLLPPPPQ